MEGNKTKVKITNGKGCRFYENDEGYIDGYVSGGDGVPYAVVVIGTRMDLVKIYNLKAISETN